MAADLLNAAQVLDPQTIRSNSKKEGTRKSYRNDIGTFALYCYNHDEPEYNSLLSNVLIEQWDNIMARNDITARRAVQVQKKKDKLMKEILKDRFIFRRQRISTRYLQQSVQCTTTGLVTLKPWFMRQD